MYGFKECSSCGALYNREHCCSNVSSIDNFVHDPNQISYDETPDSHQQPPRNCSNCGVENHSLNLNPNSFIDSPNIFNPPPQPQTYSCELCGNDAHYGYDCPLQVPLVYASEPCYNQNFDNFQQTSPSFPQQYLCCTRCGRPHETFQCQQLIFYNPEPSYNQDFDNDFPQSFQSYPQQYPCCENCGGPHETFQCQPMNQNFYKPNLCYNSFSSGFDQFQPLQFPVIHQPPQEMSIQDMEDLKQQYLDEMKSLINKIQIKDYHDEKIDIEIKENFNGMSIEINKKKKLQQVEQVANLSTYPSRHFNYFCYNDDDDDDGEFSIPMSEIYKSSLTAITPNSPITDSLIMEDEHLNTILEMESDEENKSSVEELNLTPSESEDLSEDLSDIEITL
ncbi:hypothetical protein Tco_1325688 [Tanacetum coccineum]